MLNGGYQIDAQDKQATETNEQNAIAEHVEEIRMGFDAIEDFINCVVVIVFHASSACVQVHVFNLRLRLP